MLIILRGVPGAGKTTFAKFLESTLPDAIAVSADDWMFAEGQQYSKDRLSECHGNCESTVEEAMRIGKATVILHNTATREWEFELYLRLAEYYGYQVVSMIMENRHGNRSVHSTVTDEVAERFADRFEMRLHANRPYRGGRFE